MATKKASKRSKSTAKRKGLVCPECGFKAAHPMGLGRHRTTRHGVPSKRELMRRGAASASKTSSREVAALSKRLSALEDRHERLMAALLAAVKSGRAKG